jgi:hypothetical protein
MADCCGGSVTSNGGNIAADSWSPADVYTGADEVDAVMATWGTTGVTGVYEKRAGGKAYCAFDCADGARAGSLLVCISVDVILVCPQKVWVVKCLNRSRVTRSHAPRQVGTSLVGLGEWTHVACTWAAGSGAQLYINGVLDAADAAAVLDGSNGGVPQQGWCVDRLAPHYCGDR